MAKKTAAELREALAKAEELEAQATEGLTESLATYNTAMEPFGLDENGNVAGSPEELEVLIGAQRDLVSAIRANWKFRGLPTQTEERRAAAIYATNLSKARKAIKEKTATDEQKALVKEHEARKAAAAAEDAGAEG